MGWEWISSGGVIYRAPYFDDDEVGEKCFNGSNGFFNGLEDQKTLLLRQLPGLPSPAGLSILSCGDA